MTLGQSIQTVFRKYAEFDGRASRSEFWWWILFTALVSAALNVFPTWGRVWGADISPWSGLAGLWAIAVLVPTLAVTIRRLRDAGYEWGHIFWILLPLAGAIVLIVLCAQPPRRLVVAAEHQGSANVTAPS